MYLFVLTNRMANPKSISRFAKRIVALFSHYADTIQIISVIHILQESGSVEFRIVYSMQLIEMSRGLAC